MADDDRLHKARIDGSHAQTLLNDELLQAAFASLEEAYAKKLLSTTVEQTQAREVLYQAHRVVGQVKNHLRSVLDNGKLANAELDNLISLSERKRGIFGR